ncbi:MAG: serine/threonine-protein kinase, partial [Kiritimatiellia bacterium]
MAYPVIPGYQIKGVLGEGGMGTVYLAVQESLGRKVAIKILPPSLACNESYLMRFRHEARAAAKIRHPNIVQIYDAGEHNSVYFFIMEYIDGETSGSRVARKGRLDEQSALLIAESVAVALEYAWDRAQLVHRDIKPDNILI